MDTMEIVKAIQERERISNAELARKAGKSPQNLNNILGVKNPKVETLMELVGAMGYRVVVTKDEANGYEIGGESEYIEEREEGSVWRKLNEIEMRLAEVESIVK